MHSYTHLRASSKNLRTKERRKKKRKNLRISSITYFSSPRVSASLLDPLPLAALSTSRRNDQAPLRNADDRVGIGGWVLNHVLAVRKERKKKKNKRLSWTSKLEFPVDCRGKRRVYAVAAAIAISRGINQRARKREERGGSIAPSRDHLARFIRANSLSKRRSIPDWRVWKDARTEILPTRPNLISRQFLQSERRLFASEPRARTCRGHVCVHARAGNGSATEMVCKNAAIRDKDFSIISIVEIFD